MSDALATVEQRNDYEGLTMVVAPQVALRRLGELQAFVKEVMVPNIDYGVIPGTEKPTLLQPGAQKLCEIYGFTPSFLDMNKLEDWDKPLFHYEVKCQLTSRRDGLLIGEGIGSCNSREKRYAGRWAFDNEIPAGINKATLKKKEGKSKKNGRPYTQFFIPNDDIFTLVNTIRKMACKRALVMATIGATRSSALFTQDMEDSGDRNDYRQEQEAPPQEQAPDLQENLRASVELNERKAKAHEELRAVLIGAHDEKSLEAGKSLMKDAIAAKMLTKPMIEDLIALGQERKAAIVNRGLDAAADNAIGAP